MKQSVTYRDTFSDSDITISIEGKAAELSPAGAAAFKAEYDALARAILLLLDGTVRAELVVKQAAQAGELVKPSGDVSS